MPPLSVQVPVMVFPFTVPESCSVLPLGDPDTTTKAKWPVTLPLKSPLKEKLPLTICPETKQGEFVEKLKLVMLSVPSWFTKSEVANANSGLPFASVSVAVQVPLMSP